MPLLLLQLRSPTVPLPPRVTMTPSSTSFFTPSNVSTSVPCAPNVYELALDSNSTFRSPTNSAPPSSIISGPKRCLITTLQPLIAHSAVPSVHEPSDQTKHSKPIFTRMPQNPSVVTPALIVHSRPFSMPCSRSTSSLIVKTRTHSSVPSVPEPSLGGPILQPTSELTTTVVPAGSPVPIANTALTDIMTSSHTLSRAIRSSAPKNNASPGRVESSLPSDGIHHIHSLHSTPKHSLTPTPSNQTPCPTLHLNEVIRSRRSVMKPSSYRSSITRHLKALMGSVIDGKRSRSSH